uniref:Homologous recombination OB-fold protein OB-fold domain-containing protein n=1 Tax=Tanacetum cinerariifolium TaxID=118510 RepID=A0A6L2J1Z9_TANCI|nr:hypothetical protein [Tanacetum cinerariifolium]
MNAKLVWLREKYNYHSQTHIGGPSSQTHEIVDVYLIEKELHQLHLDEEALRETLEEEKALRETLEEEEAMDEKERDEKIRQKQVDDELFVLEFEVKYDSEYDDGAVMSTQEYMKKVVEDVGDIENFLKNEKLDQVVAIVKSCSPNVIGDLTATMKDLSGTIPETIHHKVVDGGGYEKNITVRAALILANVSVFAPKPSMHYINITMRNVIKFFRKDTISENDSS